MHITIEIAPGELIDKLTIINIKLERITDHTKLKYVQAEHAILNKAFRKIHNSLEANKRTTDINRLSGLTKTLERINKEIWIIEDNVRNCEQHNDFGQVFINLARSVYKINDKRASIKKEINELLGSDIREEKLYAEYINKESPHVTSCNEQTEIYRQE